jgi:uncharacterized protein DUF6624
MDDAILADELIAMAEEQLAAQHPLAELLERDPVFAEWVERAVTAWVPLPLAEWDGGKPPTELVRTHEILDRHDERLAAIIADVGWPGRALVGEDGADAAWLLAQHADRHQTIRASWLPLLERAVTQGDADPRHLSRLTDRIAMIDRRPQRFGTYSHLRADGEVEWDIPAEGSQTDIDFRRRAIGLPPLMDDLAEPPGTGPYRYLRTTPAFAWPKRE